MTDRTCLGTRCALKRCRKPLRDDEGVGVVTEDKIAWMHSRCARLYHAAQARKKEAEREAAKKETS